VDLGPRSRNRTAVAGSELPVAGRSEEDEPRRGAAEALRSAVPDVLDAYRANLQRVESVLVERTELWQSCRRQAVAILDDCIVTLEKGYLPETTEAEEYTRLLGANRALQKVPVAESVRAAELLWSAVQQAVRAAAASAAPQQRAVIWQKVNAAFRAAASVRLYAGSQGYDETRDRLLASAAAHSRERQPRTALAPARKGNDDSSEELTPRERQILDAVALALTNRQIARQLGISEGTVKRHLHNIFNKLGATSRMDAVLKGAERR
jgi:DNA-binding NarL/FixJ family response regulator